MWNFENSSIEEEGEHKIILMEKKLGYMGTVAKTWKTLIGSRSLRHAEGDAVYRMLQIPSVFGGTSP
jgi:hypothetical protein